jgi:hypothetical protein
MGETAIHLLGMLGFTLDDIDAFTGTPYPDQEARLTAFLAEVFVVPKAKESDTTASVESEPASEVGDSTAAVGV